MAMGIGMVIGVSLFLNGEDIGLKLGDTINGECLCLHGGVIKQNELEVCNDTLLVSDHFYILNICQ